jgi:membrane-bound serine protease (ClpP class)
VHEAREGHFLEVNGQRAVELKLAEGYARDREELQRLLKLSEKPRVLVTTAVDTAVWILNNPFITGLLFVVGLIALYVELSAPGISIGGLISLLCFALFFWSRFLGGTAELLEVVLFLVGVSFLALEIFVIPGFGFAGIMGILLVLASVVMASQNFVVPTTGRQLEAFATTLLVVTCSGAASLAVAALLSRYFGTLPVFKRLVLQPAVPAAEAALTPGVAGKRVPAPAAGAEVGDWGVALSPLRPAGKARFGDQYLDVITDGAFVDAGRPVRITEICGPRIVVQDVEEM